MIRPRVASGSSVRRLFRRARPHWPLPPEWEGLRPRMRTRGDPDSGLLGLAAERACPGVLGLCRFLCGFPSALPCRIPGTGGLGLLGALWLSHGELLVSSSTHGGGTGLGIILITFLHFCKRRELINIVDEPNLKSENNSSYSLKRYFFGFVAEKIHGK